MKMYKSFEQMYKATNNGKTLMAFNDDEEQKQEIPSWLAERWGEAGNKLKEYLKEFDKKYNPDLTKMVKGQFISLRDNCSSLSTITKSISDFCKACLDKGFYAS